MILFFHRTAVQFQRYHFSVWTIFGIRNPIYQSETNQRLPLCWNEHLQCGCTLSNHGTRRHGNRIPTRCILRIRVPRRDFLLFSKHVAHLCT